MLEYLESGLRQGEFCRLFQISVSTLQYWLRRVRSAHALPEEPEGPQEEIQPSSRLVEVTVTGGGLIPQRPIAAQYEVVIANGRSLRIPSGFDPQEVASLLTLLEGR